ncbi:putative bifunctional diguanylate cyclase/phosphodiesterase [Aeromicrobium chenweiae]|uniref:GGDEF domain-containing protein n=1 Tax=Aeromicrobium chenweiae TaxID=2079793 RepID=A0A2S0WLG3_9ACTN|nr:EAL domain-containing protein [Aeromicrobium chenweiae]AWB92132.1 GGDEF domain-containing protein [Aeromicrobium chenweiae]TGN32982.1 EAL domain-containing protein [Aeromicrobium chenweiae]
MTDDPNGFDFEALFRAAPVGAVVAAADGTILDVNDRFTSWTGLDHDDLLGTSFLRLLTVGDRIVFSTRTAPLLELAGHVPEIAVTVLGADRTRLPATLDAAQVMTEPAVTLFVLAPRRQRSVEEAQLISAVHRAEADLERAARRDALTGLLNRTGLVHALTDSPSIVEHEPAVGAFWIGLDHFRVVVESLGHAAGDDVLNTLAQRLRDRFREPALLGRVGGDEFVVVLPETALEEDADDILALVAEPMMADDLEIVVSASVGVATGGVGSLEAADALLRQASAGMYAAKAAGRNRWKRSAAITDGAAVDEIRLLGEIRAALTGDELRLEYQPQLDLRTGRLHGVEALIRWNHPTRGAVPPSGFIDVAEKSGLISQIGTWACATAIAQAVELNSDAAVPVQVSVNISARQLGEPRFAGTVASLLGATDLNPGLLTLEITETGLITDAPQVRENLVALHEQGVQLSIDDFGTGHASIAYLNDFPVDEIKIDRSYVDRLDSPEGTAIVVSCIELAHALSVSVVAEGVETADQLSRLAELGCDIVQGYHYSRPLSPDALSGWLAKGGPLPR